jgi:hypothetical protein
MHLERKNSKQTHPFGLAFNFSSLPVALTGCTPVSLSGSGPTLEVSIDRSAREGE